jgi:hypothetical protein
MDILLYIITEGAIKKNGQSRKTYGTQGEEKLIKNTTQ